MKKKLFVAFLCVFTLYSWGANIPTVEQVGAENLPAEISPITAPFDMPQLTRPIFPDRVVNIAKKGAKQNKLCTKVIQKAIDELSKKGGGTVLIPSGSWLTGRITLKNNINLHIEEGAELHFSGDVKDYLPAVFTRNEGVEMYSLGSLIYANGAENIAITGKGRLIAKGDDCEIYRHILNMETTAIEKIIPDGLEVEKRIYDGKNGSPIFLPMFFGPINSKNILVEGVTFENSIFWNIVPQYCENVIIRGVTVNSTGHPRTDGIDIDSSRNVLIEYTTLSCGDDCFTIKSGRGMDGLRANKPSENIVIRYCKTKQGVGGLTCGSETAAMIRNLYVHDCVFYGTSNGFYFKTRRPRGGGGENLYFERIRLNVPKSAIRWDMLGSKGSVGELAERLPKRPINPLTPVFRNITFKDVSIEKCKKFIAATAIPESPLTGVSMTNMDVKSDELISLEDVDGFVISNSKIQSNSAEVSLLDCQNVMFINVELDIPGEKLQPVYSGELCQPIIQN